MHFSIELTDLEVHQIHGKQGVETRLRENSAIRELQNGHGDGHQYDVVTMAAITKIPVCELMRRLKLQQ